MNMHVLQSADLQRSQRHQDGSSTDFSPQANKPVLGIVQDSLLGSYLLDWRRGLLGRKTSDGYCNCVVYPLKKLIPPSEPYKEPSSNGKAGVFVFLRRLLR